MIMLWSGLRAYRRYVSVGLGMVLIGSVREVDVDVGNGLGV